MVKLSKLDKEFVLKELNSQLSIVHLKCDGYSIFLNLERFKMKLVIGIYINGSLKGDWFSKPEDYPESKFLPIKRRALYSTKVKNQIIKCLGKRRAAKEYPELNEMKEYKFPYFSSANAAITHLQNICESIEIIKEQTPYERLSKIA